MLYHIVSHLPYYTLLGFGLLNFDQTWQPFWAFLAIRLRSKTLTLMKYRWMTRRSQRRNPTRLLRRDILPRKSSFISHAKHCGLKITEQPFSNSFFYENSDVMESMVLRFLDKCSDVNLQRLLPKKSISTKESHCMYIKHSCTVSWKPELVVM